MGDRLVDSFNEHKNLRTGSLALSAYRTSIAATRAEIYENRSVVASNKSKSKPSKPEADA
jgi:hypothetical protein